MEFNLAGHTKLELRAKPKLPLLKKKGIEHFKLKKNTPSKSSLLSFYAVNN